MKRLTLLPLLAACLAGAGAHAAELGEVKVNSHIGQQLSADIELVDLTPADLADLQVRLANPDVFKGANISINPALSGLYMSVARHDQRRVIHLTTLQPVTAEALHLFIELGSGGRQVIRAATLWLTPEPPVQRAVRAPAQAPAALPAVAPAPATAPSPAVPAASASVPVRTPAAAEPAGATPLAPLAAAPRTGASGANAPGAAAPSAARPAASEADMAAAAERAFAARKLRPAVSPATSAGPAPKAPPPVPQVAAMPAAQACAPAQVEEQVQQCKAMTGKLEHLEDKVKQMQTALAAPVQPAKAEAPAAQPQAQPAKPAAPAQPAAKPGATKPGSAKPAAAPAKSNLMLIIGGAVALLAVLGGLIYLIRKRRAAGEPLKIWQSFRKKAEPEAQEPVLEEKIEATAQE